MAGSFQEFRYGWPVVVAAAIGIGLGMSPLPFYTIGVFAISYQEAFGWGMGKTLSGLAVFTLTAFFMSPVIGYVADRVGVRKVILFSLVTFSLSMMAFGLNTSGSYTQYLVTWAIAAVFGVGTLPITWTRVVNGWFNERRGLALGCALLATGIFGAFAKLFAAKMIELYGWQMAYVAVGALPLVIALPIAWVAFRPVDDPRVAHRAERLKQAAPSAVTAGTDGMPLKTALTDWRFWLLAYAFVPISFAVGGPIPNLEQIMLSKGFDVDDAVFLATFIGYSVLVGRLVGGYLIDRFWAPGVAVIIMSLPALSCWMLQGADQTMLSAAVAVFILGAAAGVEYDLMAFLVSKYFGLRNYSAIYGTLYAFFAAGAGFGPLIFGRAYDATGNYDPILIYAGIALLAGAIPLIFLGKYRHFKGAEIVSDESSTAPT
ncbi:MAG: MFS transporter [Pseudomonadota bacterium]